MSGSPPKEIQGISAVEEKQPAKVFQFIPHEEKTWSDNMGAAARRADASFKPGDEIPSSAQTIQNQKVSTHIQPGVNAEPFIDPADVADITKRTTGHVVSLINRQEGLSAHGETTPGRNIFSVIRSKIQKMRARPKKAA